MVNLSRRANGGFALAELIISTAISMSVSAGLIMGFISLKRSFAATMDFATNHADQMRISDYMALDFRRAMKVDPPSTNDVTMYIPCYYDSTPAKDVQTPVLDGKGGVYYGAADCSVRVHYYLAGNAIYRKQDNDPAVALASDVQDFVFDVSDLGKVVTTSITFKPTYRSEVASTAIAKATAFNNTTLLRNNRGVY